VSTIRWTESATTRSVRWHSENASPPPHPVVPVDDTIRADTAVRLAVAGTGLLWRGDYHNGRQLLAALGRRVDRSASPGVRATVLGRLLIHLDADYALNLRRAPDVRPACVAAYGPPTGPMVVSLRELLGVLGAHQWRLRGVAVPALGARVHPHYGVFAPVRGEYVDLVATAPLPARRRTAFDLGTGTGVLAAVLARRGIAHVTATDSNPRALACARDNVARLGLAGRIDVRPGLYPDGRADLVVANPPWLPGRPTSTVDGAVYDPDSAMLRGVLSGLSAHLAPGGEGWLVLSDLAERFGLRTREWLLGEIAGAGLRVVGRLDTRPRHPRAADPTDPRHAARRAEVVTLWRLS
jgi:SAM-dependent methyltransferase